MIAVEQQARERLERLSALFRIKPVDINKLSQQLNQQSNNLTSTSARSTQETNGFIENSPIYVTSLPNTEPLVSNHVTSSSASSALVNNVTSASSTTATVKNEIVVPAIVNSSSTQQNHSHHSSQFSDNKVDATKSPKSPKSSSTQHTPPTPHNKSQHQSPAANLKGPTTLQQNKTQNCTTSSGSVGVPSSGPLGSGVITQNNHTTVTNNLNNNNNIQRPLSERRASSPFQNGRTEVLIGADDNKFKTTAIVENTTRLGVDSETTR